MLGYRHAFHAGNHGDVLKHCILIFCLEYLKQKDKAFYYIDTHAGAGEYSLNNGYAAQNREWEQGISRLYAPKQGQSFDQSQNLDRDTVQTEGPHPSIPLPVSAYIECCGSFLERGFYPGSPAIAKALLRKQDRGFCFELHPADHQMLQRFLSENKRFQIRGEDGFKGLISLLPPLTRRACILIDPSYELKSDYTALPHCLEAAFKRFPSGTYIVWYPLLGRKEAQQLPSVLTALKPENYCRLELAVTSSNASPWGMYGSGIIVFNPPWELKEQAESSLTFLASFLGDKNASWNMEWH